MREVKARLSAYRETKEKPQHQLQDVGASNKEETDDSKVFSVDERTSESDGHSSWRVIILKLVLWLLLWGFFIEIEFGVVFLVLSALYFMYSSMSGSRRKAWEPSPYSVFNKNCEAIEGTLSAEQFERELRYGPSFVKK